MATESETYFERFCEKNGFTLVPVPVTTTKTPDYTLMRDGQLVVVEVKEVQPTPEELESERLARERGYGNVGHRTRLAKDRQAVSPNPSSGHEPISIRAVCQGDGRPRDL